MASRHSNGTRCANTNGPVSAVSYLRASSDKQETSVPDQRKAVQRYAEANGYRLTGEYVDDGVSGDDTAKRQAFQKMIADAGSGKFKAIVCWDQDRFGRFSPHEASYWTWPLLQQGVQLVTTDRGPIDWTEFTAWLTFSVNQHAKHQFLKDLSRNVMRGKIEAVKRGDWISRAPFAYRKKQKRLHLGPEFEIALVRRIFTDYLKGGSIRGLCLTLNGEGIPSSRGGQWSPTAIRRLMRNRAYIGHMVYNRVRQGKYHAIVDGEIGPESKRGQTDEADWLVVENTHKPIVDAATFDRVQKRLAIQQAKTTPKTNGGPYMFTGLCRCDKYGSPMHGVTRNGDVRYECSKGHWNTLCDRNSTKQDQLLDVVLMSIKDQFLNGDVIERLRKEMRQQIGRQSKPATSTRRLQSQLDTVGKKLDKAKRRLVEVDSDLLDVVQEQIRELRREQQRLQDALNLAQTPQKQRQQDVDEIIEAAIGRLQRVHSAFHKADTATQRELIQQSIQRIDIRTEREETGRRPYRLRSGVIHLRRSNGEDLCLLS